MGESQNECYKKTKHAKSKNEYLFTYWYAHVLLEAFVFTPKHLAKKNI